MPEELAAAGFTGVTAEFDGQDGTLTCAQPLDDPEQATEEAYGVWGVHAITLDRSCRVNRAPETGDGETSSAGEATAEQSNVVQAVAAGVDGTIVYPTIGDLLDTDPRLSYLSMLLSEAGLTEAMRQQGRSRCSRPPMRRSRSSPPTPMPACGPSPNCSRSCSVIMSPTVSTSPAT